MLVDYAYHLGKNKKRALKKDQEGHSIPIGTMITQQEAYEVPRPSVPTVPLA